MLKVIEIPKESAEKLLRIKKTDWSFYDIDICDLWDNYLCDNNIERKGYEIYIKVDGKEREYTKRRNKFGIFFSIIKLGNGKYLLMSFDDEQPTKKIGVAWWFSYRDD